MNSELEQLVQQWLRWDSDQNSRYEIRRLAGENRLAELESVMKPRISFGTAGLRGEMGPGFARMNAVTVRQASQGLAVYVGDQVNSAQQRGIVVGHDHRHHSEEFAKLVEQAFVAKGYKVWSLGLVPTPFIPLAVIHYKAACGVMVTASHNPGKDNGYKVYWENGCQIIPPHDAGISASIDANLEPWPEVDTSDRVERGSTAIREAYFQALKPITFTVSGSTPRVVYTPIHGTGLDYSVEAMHRLGVDVAVVQEQVPKDPDFSTVRFPNPEEAGALDHAYAWGMRENREIVVANDPDADRFGCALRSEDGKSWKPLTGDEIGTLLADFLLSKAQSQSVNHQKTIVINSTVSSRRLEHLAKLYNVEYAETLTGFKWLGNRTLDYRAEGYSVPFAYEEALGYMCCPAIADKDGISALYVFLQVVQSLGGSASGLRAKLQDIASRIGHFATYNSYYRTADLNVTPHAFAAIRARPEFQKHIGNLDVVAWRDLTTGYDSSQPDHKPVLPVSKSSEMITVDLDLGHGGSARFTARGSGTEPKLKVYIEARGNSEDAAIKGAQKVWDTLSKEWFSGDGLTPA